MRRVFVDEAREREFGRRGYLVVDLLDESAVAELLAAWRGERADVHEMAFSSSAMSRDLDYRRRVHETVGRALAPPASALLDRYRFVLGTFIAKRPGQAHSVVELHQDWQFVDEARGQSVGLWCPLVDVDQRNGCLRVAPGSHRLNRRPRGYHHRFPYADLIPDLEARYLTDVPMRAGQAFVYAHSLFHSSPPNHSAHERVVASGLLVSQESQMLFFTPDRDATGQLRGYAVPDEFFRTYLFGSDPNPAWRVGSYPDGHDPLSRDQLVRALEAGVAAGAG